MLKRLFLVTTLLALPVAAHAQIESSGGAGGGGGGGTVTQGSPGSSASPWFTSDGADGPVAPGTAASKSVLGGCVYQSGGVTVSTGNQVGVQCDASGRIYVNLGSALPAGSNVIGGVTQSGTWNIGSITTLPNITIGAALPTGSNVIGAVTLSGTPSVSVTSAALPAGAATAANQVAPTAAGTPASSANPVQGVTNGVAVNIAGTVFTKPNAGSFAAPGATVGTSAANVVTAGTYNHVQIQNNSTTAVVACSWTTTAALSTATSFQLQPGQPAQWGPATAGVPPGALSCISNTASTPLYVEYN